MRPINPGSARADHLRGGHRRGRPAGGRAIDAHPNRARRPLFTFRADPDPLLVADGMRFSLIAHVGAAVPFLVAVAARPVGVSAVLAAVGALLLLLAVGDLLFHLRRAQRPHDPGTPSALATLAHYLLLTLALAVLATAFEPVSPWFALVLVLPPFLVAIVGSGPMAATVQGAAIAGVVLGLLSRGPTTTADLLAVVAFAAVSGCVTFMVGLLSTSAFRARQNLLLLVTAASAAAQAPSVEAGAAHIAELLLGTVTAGRHPRHVEVLRVGPMTTERLGRATLSWLPVEGTGATPDELVEQALRSGGLAIGPERAVIAVDEAAGTLLVLDIAVVAPEGSELHAFRFALSRYAEHVEVLVRRLNAYEELDRLGQTDGLTGLPNRRALMKRLDVERGTAPAAPSLSVVMIDLDDFKAYNDRYGHPEGDRLLVDFGTMLQKRIRAADLVARYGGEEFCLVLPSTDVHGAQRLVDELHTWAALLRPGQPVTFSAGLTRWNGDEPVAALVARADRALYQAKAEGKDRTVVATPAVEDPSGPGELVP